MHHDAIRYERAQPPQKKDFSLRRLQSAFHRHIRKTCAHELHRQDKNVEQAQWYAPRSENPHAEFLQFHEHDPGEGYVHPLSPTEIMERILVLPQEIQEILYARLDHVVLPRHTKKSDRVPMYGLQWGSSIYLHPQNEPGTEIFTEPPATNTVALTKRFGARWQEASGEPYWICQWTRSALREFYREYVLLHELGHVCDGRNANIKDSERYANAFAEMLSNPPLRNTRRKPRHRDRKYRRHDKK